MDVDAEPPPEVKAAPRFRFRLADLLTATLLFGGQLTYVMQGMLADEKSARVGSVVFVGVLSAMAAFGALLIAVKKSTYERMGWPSRFALMVMLDVTLFLMLPVVLPALFIFSIVLLGAFVVMFPLAIPIIFFYRNCVNRTRDKVETGR